MKKILGILVLSLLWCNISLANNFKVIDGDTIKLNVEKIRFSGIDAPESNYKGKEQICFINETIVRCGKLSKVFLIKTIGKNLLCIVSEHKNLIRIIILLILKANMVYILFMGFLALRTK